MDACYIVSLHRGVQPERMPAPCACNPSSHSACVLQSRSRPERWPAGSGVMRRPLVPLPNRPNPTDPGDAADLSIPQGYLSRVVDGPAITIGNDPSTY